MLFKKISSGFILVLLFYVQSFAQAPQFFREKIEVIVEKEDYCQLKGIYYFKNISEKIIEQVLFYPFVINDELPYPDSIKVVNMRDNKPVPFTKSKKGIFFSIQIPPKSIYAYNVNYYQKTPACSMEYILTTTKTWNRPLDQAEFIIKIPLSFNLISLSMKFNKKVDTGDKTIYYIIRKNFMPETNLLIKWERKIK